ncbi:MAG: hypothetical protein M1812_000848 [Candelaria pacifica]|nr:MAG: hypothetical protein M1812_000848 [Candelaria pacifica]
MFDALELKQHETWLKEPWKPVNEGQTQFREIERQLRRLQEKRTLVEVAKRLPIIEEQGVERNEAVKLLSIEKDTEEQQRPKRSATEETHSIVEHVPKRARITIGQSDGRSESNSGHPG